MSDKPNWQEYGNPVAGGDKIAVDVHDARYGKYKDEQLEGKQVAPKHDPSPFTAGGNTPKEK